MPISPENMQRWLETQGYEHVRQLPNGQWAGLQKMAFTTGLMVGLDEQEYQRRYCYEHETDAFVALAIWDGTGDPQGPWIKEKPGDRLGPGATG